MAHTQTGPPTQHTRSVTELVDDATKQITRLVRDELQLARVEMQDRTKGIARGAGIAGASGLVAFYGGIALTVAAIFALALVLPEWAAALIVGAALLVIGAILALVGKKNVSSAAPPVPQEAVHGIKDDIDTIKDGSRR
ncbi:phage holin family protein [Nocardia coubleae]|uniref:Phage holin family protein n=1 Tax=Nocardia coubleae TaxID=356147 RepID=A0A846VZU3_9NOCA|nr:phage holin family protein [Nocardia coubleae]NKX86361.1 phage holin family protein [Nocardia coubleae]